MQPGLSDEQLCELMQTAFPPERLGRRRRRRAKKTAQETPSHAPVVGMEEGLAVAEEKHAEEARAEAEHVLEEPITVPEGDTWPKQHVELDRELNLDDLALEEESPPAVEREQENQEESPAEDDPQPTVEQSEEADDLAETEPDQQDTETALDASAPESLPLDDADNEVWDDLRSCTNQVTQLVDELRQRSDTQGELDPVLDELRTQLSATGAKNDSAAASIDQLLVEVAALQGQLHDSDRSMVRMVARVDTLVETARVGPSMPMNPAGRSRARWESASLPTMILGVSVLLMTWAVIFYIKTGSLKLSLGAVVIANVVTCAAFVWARRRARA